MSKELKSWTLLIILSLIWGSSFILMKRGMFTLDGQAIFSDTQVASIRMIIAGVVLLPFALRSLLILKNPSTFLFLLSIGLLGNLLPAFLFTYAETSISSGLTGMLNSLTPIFALSIGFLIFKQQLTKIQVSGVVVGIIGAVLLVYFGNDSKLSGDAPHLLAIILATLCYGISLNIIKYKLSHLKSIEIASLAFLTVLIPSIVIGFISGSFVEIQTNENAAEGLFFIALLSIIGTAIALILFNQLIALTSVLFSSSVTYLIPVVAMLIGVSFGESITLIQVASMLVILSGVFIANVLGRK
jgi:drug/metabolite transporter (DMT)-like permease